MFQLTFAIITPALIAGAFADRMKFSAMLVFMAAWSLLVYAPIAHMVWEPTGWLNAAGVLDYAGGTVVHINAGIAGLASCLVLGKRSGYGRERMPPHNLTLTLIGASLLWVGWFGFNAGSARRRRRARRHGDAGDADGDGGGRARLDVRGVVQPRVSRAFSASPRARWPGLVAITPASGFVAPTAAVIIGLAAGVMCLLRRDLAQARVGLRRFAGRFRRARHRRHRRRVVHRRFRKQGDQRRGQDRHGAISDPAQGSG